MHRFTIFSRNENVKPYRERSANFDLLWAIPKFIKHQDVEAFAASVFQMRHTRQTERKIKSVGLRASSLSCLWRKIADHIERKEMVNAAPNSFFPENEAYYVQKHFTGVLLIIRKISRGRILSHELNISVFRASWRKSHFRFDPSQVTAKAISTLDFKCIATTFDMSNAVIPRLSPMPSEISCASCHHLELLSDSRCSMSRSDWN